MNVREYMGHTHLCPECGSDNLMDGQFDPLDNAVYQDVLCQDCRFEWSDRYELTGIADEDEAYYFFMVPDEVEKKAHNAVLCMKDRTTLEILGHTFHITVVDGVPVILEVE